MLATPSDHQRSIITITSVALKWLARTLRLLHLEGRAFDVGEEPGAAASPETSGVFELRPGIIRTDMTGRRHGQIRCLDRRAAGAGRRWASIRHQASWWRRLLSASSALSTGSIINVDGALSVPRL